MSCYYFPLRWGRPRAHALSYLSIDPVISFRTSSSLQPLSYRFAHFIVLETSPTLHDALTRFQSQTRLVSCGRGDHRRGWISYILKTTYSSLLHTRQVSPETSVHLWFIQYSIVQHQSTSVFHSRPSSTLPSPFTNLATEAADCLKGALIYRLMVVQSPLSLLLIASS